MRPSNQVWGFVVFTCVCSMLITVSTAQDKRYFTGDNTNENDFDKIAKSAQLATRDLNSLPSSFSLRQYAPVPGNQGDHGTCVAWSTSYAARTISYCIQHQITDPAKIKQVTFSPEYIYYHVKKTGDHNCQQGANIEPAMKILAGKGDVLLSENIDSCVGNLDTLKDIKAQDYTIKAYTSITNIFNRIQKNEVLAIKKSLSENKPIVFSVNCLKSLFNVGKDGAWNIPANDEKVSSHAICIVGYDDNKLDGAFEVMNSWGTDWGNDGFFWLTYKQIMEYGSYALEMMDREVYDPKILRGLAPPKIKGSLDFVLVNEFGNDAGTMPVRRNKIDATTSSITNDSNASFSYYSLLENYPAGQRFKIKFTTNAPAFVYIISVDNKQEVSTLFPYAANISPAVNSTNATIYLPSEVKHYILDANTNRDRICVVYSKTPIDFNKLRQAASTTPEAIFEAIKLMFQQRLIPAKRTEFADDKISFSTTATEQELVCFFIDLNRK